MSEYKPQKGDVIVVETLEAADEWFAKVDRVTEFGTPVVWRHQRTRKGGDTKPRSLNQSCERIVRKAAPFEAAAFERGEL